MENSLNDMAIANAVKNGHTSGNHTTLDIISWKIKVEEDENDEESNINYIAEMVERGYRSGYYPTWKLSIKFKKSLSYKIKVVKSDDSRNWYAHRVNEVFTVFPKGGLEKDFGDEWYYIGEGDYILKSDCEVLN